MERVKAGLEEAKAAGNAELVKLKEEELAGMLDKQSAESYAVAIAQQEVSEWSRLPADPVSLLSPTNKPKSDDDASVDNCDDALRLWALPLQESLVAGFAAMQIVLAGGTSLEVPKSVSASTSPPRRSKKQRLSDIKEDISGPSSGHSFSSWPPFTVSSADAVEALSLRAEDVAKLTPERITSTLVLPFSHKTVIICGDKEGSVGLWDVDASSSTERGNPEGIYKYRPHVSGVCNIHCNSNSVIDSRCYTSSYDGTIRCLDLGGSGTRSDTGAAFRLLFETPESIANVMFSDVQFSPFTDDSVFIGRNDGKIGFKDFRTRSDAGYQWLHQLHEYKVNSVQQHPTDPNYLVSASSTKLGYISVHDIRKLSPKTPSICDLNAHSLSINAAYSSPGGEYLVSVSQDNTVKVWKDWLRMAQLHSSTKSRTGNAPITSANHSFKHDNHTGRWLSTFRPVFDVKNPTTFALGCMEHPRRMDLFTITESLDGSVTTTVKKLSSPNLNSICSRNSFHPFENILAVGNSSGRVHVFR